MVNILRMDLYRLLHGKSLWVFLAVIVGLVIMTSGIMAIITSPGFTESMQSASTAAGGFHLGITNPNGTMMDADDYADVSEATAMLSGSMTQISFIGSMFLSGGGLTVIFAIFIALFLASEFESGFSKNVFTTQPNRFAFLGARVIEIILLAAVFTAVTVGASLLAMAIGRVNVIATPLPELLLWSVLVTLVVAGFGMLTALFVWWTRKMAVGIVAGILLGAGLATVILQGFLLLFPSMKHLADFTLSSCSMSLAQGVNLAGGLSAVHIAGVAIAFIVISAALSAIALQKKDI